MLKLQEQADKLSDIRGEVTEIGWATRSVLTLCSHTPWSKTTVPTQRPETSMQSWTAEFDLFIKRISEVDCPRNRSERGRSIIRLWAEHSDK